MDVLVMVEEGGKILHTRWAPGALSLALVFLRLL